MTSTIAQAVAPYKAQSQTAARARAEKMILEFVELAEANDWDLQKFAPFPHSQMSKKAYVEARKFYTFARHITTLTTTNHQYRAPEPCVLNQHGVDKFFETVESEAGQAFDDFVLKLETKVGEYDSAIIDHGSVWFDSTLEVTKGDKKERWNTKCIINVSCLGKLFNQWPTRLKK